MVSRPCSVFSHKNWVSVNIYWSNWKGNRKWEIISGTRNGWNGRNPFNDFIIWTTSLQQTIVQLNRLFYHGLRCLHDWILSFNCPPFEFLFKVDCTSDESIETHLNVKTLQVNCTFYWNLSIGLISFSFFLFCFVSFMKHG